MLQAQKLSRLQCYKPVKTAKGKKVRSFQCPQGGSQLSVTPVSDAAHIAGNHPYQSMNEVCWVYMWKSKVNNTCLPPSRESLPLTKPGAHQFSKASCLQSFRNPHALTTPVLGLQTCTTKLSFYVGPRSHIQVLMIA